MVMQLEFTSYSSIDDDYKGYDYSLVGQLSEVRIIYLNRFIQEVIHFVFISSLSPLVVHYFLKYKYCHKKNLLDPQFVGGYRLLVTLWALFPMTPRV